MSLCQTVILSAYSFIHTAIFTFTFTFTFMFSNYAPVP
jgi:hypothetical protein